LQPQIGPRWFPRLYIQGKENPKTDGKVVPLWTGEKLTLTEMEPRENAARYFPAACATISNSRSGAEGQPKKRSKPAVAPVVEESFYTDEERADGGREVGANSGDHFATANV
jgi:hypothetical protein